MPFRNRNRLGGLRRPAQQFVGRNLGSGPVFKLGWDSSQIVPIWGPMDNDPVNSTGNTYLSGGGVYRSFRAPHCVRLANGQLAEFVVGCESGTLDYQVSSIFCRYSSDEGKTWSTPQFIYRRSDYASGTKWINGPVVPVVHPSGRIHVLFTKSDATTPGTDDVMTLYSITSPDNCATWSGETNISANTIKVNNSQPASLPAAYGLTNARWNWYMLTCGIVIQNGPNAGRIVVAGDHRYTVSDTSWSHCIYTDNGSSATPTWALGGGFDETNASNNNSNECEVMEVGTSGALYFNCRIVSGSGANKRGQTTLTAGSAITATWPTMTYMQSGSGDVDANQCHAGSLRANDGSLYMSFPVNKGLRSRMKVFRSTDNGATWPTSRSIYYGYCAYSNLIDLRGGLFRVGFEYTHNYAADSVFAAYIGQARFNKKWLTSTSTPSVFDWSFNELAAGQGTASAANTGGTVFLDSGKSTAKIHNQRGKGGSAATFDANGLLFAGSGNPVILQELENDGIGGALDPGNDSITYEFECKVPNTPGSTLTVYDSSNGSNSVGKYGITIYFNINGKLQATIRDSADHSVTTGTPASNTTDNTFRCFAVVIDRTANTIRCYETTSGTAVAQGSAGSMSAFTAPIYGTQAGSLGSQAGGTNKMPANSYIRRFRVTRAALTSGWLSTNASKPTADTLWGYSPTTTATGAPPTFSNNVLWLGATIDRGAYARLDPYGAWDRPRLPAIRGQGAINYRDIAGNIRFNFGNSLTRGMYLDTDSDIGDHWRHMYLSTTTCGNYLCTQTSLTNYDMQNTGGGGAFSAFICIKLLADNTVALFDNCNNQSNVIGWGLYRSSGSGSITLRLSNGSGVTYFNDTFATLSMGTNTWTCMMVSGSVGGKATLYKATISGKVVSSITSVQSTNNLVGAGGASSQALSVLARSDSANYAGNCRMKNAALWTAALTQQNFSDLCSFCALY